MAAVISDSNFQETLDSGQLVVVDFWAEWCGPCKMIGPVVEEVAKKYDGKAIVGKMNVDDNSEVPTNFNVRSIPTIVFLKGGKEVARHVGTITQAALEQKIESYL
jgi:thioredoxin 1